MSAPESKVDDRAVESLVAAMGVLSPGTNGDAAHDVWIEGFDSVQGQCYYANSQTGEVRDAPPTGATVETPDHVRKAMIAAGSADLPANGHGEAPEGAEWFEGFDVLNGKRYFANSRTGEVRDELPAGSSVETTEHVRRRSSLVQ